MKKWFGTKFNMTSGIYVMCSTIDSRCYVGSATRLGKRFNGHKKDLCRGSHPNKRLQNFVNKYGIDCLRFDILEFCKKEDLIRREQYYMDELKPFFNIAPKAGNTLGVVCSPATREKISNANKGITKKQPPEWIDNVRALLKERNVSQDMRDKIRKTKSTPVSQYSFEGKHIKDWPSSKEVYRQLGIGGVMACCKGKMRESGGFRWRFTSENLLELPPYKRHCIRKVKNNVMKSPFINKVCIYCSALYKVRQFVAWRSKYCSESCKFLYRKSNNAPLV
ncbi:hypothetical protein C4577_02235 [Candidatus Parcubacteria bacterium]|nr:MAG: hypothetical protein C4577_02235 [Candidatus Parcubacteria bacterium]